MLGNREEFLPSDVGDHAQKVVNLIKSHDERESDARILMQWPAQFDAEKIAAQYHAIYSQLT